jgi:hypothetical protein
MKFTDAKLIGTTRQEEYHAPQAVPRGHPDFVMTSGALREFLRCPSRWFNGYVSPESEAKRWGDMLDTFILTPELWSERFAVKPATYKNEKGEVKPWNGNATKCKEWLELQSDKTVVSAREVEHVNAAKNRLFDEPTCDAFLLSAAPEGLQVQCTARWDGIPVKVLLDLVPGKDSEFSRCLGDLKSTRNASPRAFARQCYTMGYHVQAALYLDLYNAATGEQREDWCFLLSENFPPFEVGKELLSADFLALGRRTYRAALDAYARCVATKHWPGYDEHEDAAQGWTITRPEPWMEFESLSRALQLQSETAQGYTPSDEDIIP